MEHGTSSLPPLSGPVACLLNKSSSQTLALVLDKFITVITMNFVTLLCSLDAQQIHPIGGFVKQKLEYDTCFGCDKIYNTWSHLVVLLRYNLDAKHTQHSNQFVK